MKQIFTGILLMMAMTVGLVSSTSAIDLFRPSGDGKTGVDCSLNPDGCSVVKEGRGDGNKASSMVKNGINTALFLLAAVCVLMIVIGGFKYTASNGDSTIVSSAKNTILYAVIGLIVAIMAYAIVNFVIGIL